MPGQDWQIDFTHMPRHRTYRYLLVLVDTFSGWVEAFPTAREMAAAVVEVLTAHLIPRFGLPNSLQSDNGPAFISQISQQVAAALGIGWHLHIPYRPQSSGKVERHHQDASDQACLRTAAVLGRPPSSGTHSHSHHTTLQNRFDPF